MATVACSKVARKRSSLSCRTISACLRSPMLSMKQIVRSGEPSGTGTRANVTLVQIVAPLRCKKRHSTGSFGLLLAAKRTIGSRSSSPQSGCKKLVRGRRSISRSL